MTSPGPITVSYPQISQVAKDISSAMKAIDRELSDLDTYVTRLNITWQGSGYAAYQNAHRRWTKAMNEINLVLANAVLALSNGADIYRGAEQNVVNAWV